MSCGVPPPKAEDDDVLAATGGFLVRPGCDL